MAEGGGDERRSKDGGGCARVSASPPTPCAAAEDAGGGDAAPLLALDVNLAHGELCAMIEAVYGEMDALRREVQALKEERRQLQEEGERRQEELVSAVDQRAADASRLERELLAVKQEHQALSCRLEVQEAERSRLEGVVEERDKTIAEMEKLVAEASVKRGAGGGVGSLALISEEELKRAVDNFSRREQQVYGNMDYVRKASGGLQALTSELSTHVSELRREIARLQQQHTEYRTHISNHRCDAEAAKRIDARASVPAEVRTAGSKSRGEHLEQRNASLELERDALKLRCESLNADIDTIRQQLADANRVNAASRVLIEKYEESARDGTQTIEGLQESLLTVCAQLEEERVRHRLALEEVVDSSADKVRAMETEIARLHDTIATMDSAVPENETSFAIESARADLQAALDAESARRCATATRANEISPSSHRPSLPGKDAGRGLPKRDAVPDTTTVPVGGRSPRGLVSNPKRRRLQNVEEIDDSDNEEEILAAIAEAGRKPATNKPRGEDTRMPPLDPKAPCAGCCGEPFGFMVRCHKCKGQFHISCTKSTKETPAGSRTMRHVFQCVKCTPTLQQRPSKMPRKTA